MTRPWHERSDDASLVLDFQAFDAEAREAREIAAFVDAAKKPADDPLAGAGGTQSFDVVLVAIGLGIGAMLVATAHTLERALDGPVPPALLVVLFIVGVLGPPGLHLARHARRARRDGTVTDRFRVTLDRGGLTIRRRRAGREVRLAFDDIHAFETGRTPTVVRSGGARLALPFDLGVRSHNDALAARLQEALASIRATTGGYRGLRVGAAETNDTEPRTEARSSESSRDALDDVEDRESDETTASPRTRRR